MSGDRHESAISFHFCFNLLIFHFSETPNTPRSEMDVLLIPLSKLRLEYDAFRALLAFMSNILRQGLINL